MGFFNTSFEFFLLSQNLDIFHLLQTNEYVLLLFMVEAQEDAYFLIFPMKEELMTKPPQSETPVKGALDLPEVLPVGNIFKMRNLQILQERAVIE